MVAIDPFVDGRLFGGATTRDKFEGNIAAAGLTDAVELLAEYSTRARPDLDRAVDSSTSTASTTTGRCPTT